MTIPEHSSRAEKLAAEAVSYLGHPDGKDATAIRAAIAQVYATLAVAAAIEAPGKAPDPRARDRSAGNA